MITLTPLLGTMNSIQVNISHLQKEHVQNVRLVSFTKNRVLLELFRNQMTNYALSMPSKIILMGRPRELLKKNQI